MHWSSGAIFGGPNPLICTQDFLVCTTCEHGQPHNLCTEAFFPPQHPSFMPLTNACRQLFDIELQPEHVWELDSSQPNKFSRHLVVCLPQAAFACSAAVGAFVAQLLVQHEVSFYSNNLAHVVLSCQRCSRVPGSCALVVTICRASPLLPMSVRPYLLLMMPVGAAAGAAEAASTARELRDRLLCGHRRLQQVSLGGSSWTMPPCLAPALQLVAKT